MELKTIMEKTIIQMLSSYNDSMIGRLTVILDIYFVTLK